MNANAQAIQGIHELYQSAFSDILVIVGVVVGFVGIVLPLIITMVQFFQQRRENKFAHEKIDSLIALAVDELEKRLVKDQAKALEAFSERSQKLLENSKAEIERRLLRAEAVTFHVQASSLHDNKAYLAAAYSACDAVPGYVAGDDFHNLRRVLEHIFLPCLKELNKAHIKNNKILKEKYEKVISSLQGLNDNGGFYDLTMDIEREFGECQEREPPAKEA